MLINFSGSTYFRINKGVDRYLLENYLLPGLAEQGELAGGSRGIALPVGGGVEPEYLSLEEAKNLVLDFLTSTQNLLETDKKKLLGVRGYRQFADLVNNIYVERIENPGALLTASRIQNLAALREIQVKGKKSPQKYDPGVAIRRYNELYLRLLSYSRVGVPKELLAEIILPGLTLADPRLTADAVSQVIAANLPRLYSAGSVGSSPEAQSHAVARELGAVIATSYPELHSLLNVLGDDKVAQNLRGITLSVAQKLEADTPLVDYERAQIAAAASADQLLLTRSELKTKIEAVLTPIMGDRERHKLTESILREIVLSSPAALSSKEIIARVATKLSVTPGELAAVVGALESSNLGLSLEFRQNELALKLKTHYLTAGERALVARGIDPFLASTLTGPKATTRSELVAAISALETASAATSPTPDYLNRRRSLHDQLYFIDSLSPADEALIRRTHFGRSVANFRSRIYETQAKFFDKWTDIEETITGKKWLHKQLDRWDKFAEGFAIPGTKIPLFRMVPWFYDQIHAWKKATTLKNLARFSESKSWIGKTIHWSLKNYELGGFTTVGATGVIAHKAWSKVIYWASAGIVKEGAILASRTATRFLIKLGGKALARLGAKSITALAAAGTVIGAGVAIVAAVTLVIDLIKLAWNFVKEFIHNIKFRETVIKWGAAIGGAFAAINLGGVAVVLGTVFASTFVTLLLALGIVLGVLFFVPQIQNNLKTTFELDVSSELTQIFTNIVCDKESGASPVATCASCLVDYLSACYGESVTGADFQTTGIGCLIAKAIAPDVAAIIERSASSFTYLQCVGFVQASIACAGGSLAGVNACNYASNVAPGYQFVSGLAGAKQGDPVVFRSSGTCSNEAPGHIGILSQDAGALVCIIDANQTCPGCVSANNCLPKTNVAGYLKKI